MEKNKSRSAVLIIAIVLAILPILFIIGRLFFFIPYYIEDSAMEPTYADNSYLITSLIPYYSSEPSRGDVIVFEYTKSEGGDMHAFFVTRIIGLPGESIYVHDDGHVYINGSLLEEPYLDNRPVSAVAAVDDEVTLYDDRYFFLGDNREASFDSRKYGSVHKANIKGKVLFSL